jgi:hypothetical protein
MEKNMQQKFTSIEEQDVWKYDQAARVASTAKLRAQLLTFIDEADIESMVDFPSGRFSWQRELLREADIRRGIDIKYIGADIVSSITKENQLRHGMHAFHTLDLTSDPIPAADLLLVRDCLVHFTDDQIWSALRNIAGAPVRYVALTTFPTRENIARSDWSALNFWRALNLLAEPFSLPFPLWILVEHGVGNPYADKALCIWEIESLRKALK